MIASSILMIDDMTYIHKVLKYNETEWTYIVERHKTPTHLFRFHSCIDKKDSNQQSDKFRASS